jgi:hypothetical protein
MDVIGFQYVSLGSRRACTCSEAGFSSQYGDRAREVYGHYVTTSLRAASCSHCPLHHVQGYAQLRKGRLIWGQMQSS